MAKYLRLIEAKNDSDLHTVVLDIRKWHDDLGIESSDGAATISVDSTGRIISLDRFDLNYMGPRMSNSFLSHEIKMVAHKLVKGHGEWANMRIADHLEKKLRTSLWNRIWYWLKPKLNQRVLHAHYLIPVRERRGADGYNMLLQNPAIVTDLIDGDRWIGRIAYKQWLDNYHSTNDVEPWDELDLDWVVDSLPTDLVSTEIQNTIYNLHGIKMPANWLVDPDQTLKRINYYLENGVDIRPIRNTRILQATHVLHNIEEELATEFLKDIEKTWPIIRDIMKHGCFKERNKQAYRRTFQLGVWISDLRDSNKSLTFSELLKKAIELEIEKSNEVVNSSNRTGLPSGMDRKWKNTHLELFQLSPMELENTLKKLNSYLFSIPLFGDQVPHSVFVNGELKGVILLREKRDKYPVYAIGYDNKVMSKHWKDRALNLWFACKPKRKLPASRYTSARPSVKTIAEDTEWSFLT